MDFPLDNLRLLFDYYTNQGIYLRQRQIKSLYRLPLTSIGWDRGVGYRDTSGLDVCSYLFSFSISHAIWHSGLGYRTG